MTGPQIHEVAFSGSFSHCVLTTPVPEHPRLALVLAEPVTPSVDTRGLLCACEFPPQWTHLLAAHFRGKRSAWNARNALWRHVTMPALAWAGEVAYGSSGSPLHHEDEFTDATRAASWVALVTQDGGGPSWAGVGDRLRLINMNEDLWTKLSNNRPDFLCRLWGLVYGAGQRTADGSWTPVVVYGSRHPADEKVRLYTPDGVREATPADLETHLPDPGPDWCLEPLE